MPFEADLIPIVCALFLNGQPEVSHAYPVGYDLNRIRVDCETESEVIEVGLDKRSSNDSIHQALFAAHLTGKRPVVVLIDTNGREGAVEYQVRTVAAMTGVEYRSYSVDYLIRWQMTAWLRSYDAAAEALRPAG